MATLLDDSSASSASDHEENEEGNEGFKINSAYATSYNRFREKEVYQTLKDRYGEDAARGKMDEAMDDDDDTSGSSEDEDAEELTEEVERDFFKTLASLKNKDPKIYDGKTAFFKESKDDKSPKKSSKKDRDSGPMFLGDLERKVMTEKGGRFEELEDSGLARKSRTRTYQDEMDEIKREVVSAHVDGDDDEDEDDLFRVKKKSREELKNEKEEDAKKAKGYKSWLAGDDDDDDSNEGEDKEAMRGLRDFWARKDLDKGEKFLKDYILNKRYLEGSSGVRASDDDDPGEGTSRRIHDSDADLSEDERTVEKMETFENKYNFRFEEPDADFIRSYPRTVESSLRRQDNSRRKKREETNKRKKEEKERREAELRELKAMKKREIVGKLEQLRKIAGNQDLGFDDDDLEEDFDPEAHDKRMAELFGNYDNVRLSFFLG